MDCIMYSDAAYNVIMPLAPAATWSQNMTKAYSDQQ